MGSRASALLATLNTECINADKLNESAAEAFRNHLDYPVITSFPGLGEATGARASAEIRRRPRPLHRRSRNQIHCRGRMASGRTISITHRHVKNSRLAAVGFVWASPPSRGRARSRPLQSAQNTRGPACCGAAQCLQPTPGAALSPSSNRPHLRRIERLPRLHSRCGTGSRLTLYSDRSSISGLSTPPHPATPPIIDDREGRKSCQARRPLP